MKTFLSHTTALEFWRTSWPADRPVPHPIRSVRPQTYANKSREALEAAAELNFPNDARPRTSNSASSLTPVPASAPTGHPLQTTPIAAAPLQIMVFDPASRTRSRNHRCHLWRGPLPTGSFCKLGESAHVATPEFAFLLMAASLEFPQLIALGMELCGSYSFDVRHTRGFRDRTVPLTSVARLRAYLEAASGSPGIKAARAAARHLADGSRSPRETACWMFLSLPCLRGGYAVRDLLLNERIELTDAASTVARRSHCVADLFNAAGRLDVEYDGDRDHSGDLALRRDTARDNALRLMGIETFRISRTELHSLQAFENVALHIKRHLGERIDPRACGATPARIALQRSVFEWNYNGGLPRADPPR